MTLRVARGQGLLAAIFLIPLVVPWTVAGTLFYGLFNIHGVADQVSQDVFGRARRSFGSTTRGWRSASSSCSAYGKGPRGATSCCWAH